METNLILDHRGLGVESGMATVEYAIGTAAAGGLASVLLGIFRSDWMKDILGSIFRSLLSGLF